MPWSDPIPLSSLTVGVWTPVPGGRALQLMRLAGEGVLAREGHPGGIHSGPALLETRVRSGRVQAMVPEREDIEALWESLASALRVQDQTGAVRALVLWVQGGHPVAQLLLRMAMRNAGVVALVADALHLSREQRGPALAQIAMGPLELLLSLPPQPDTPAPQPAGELSLFDARLHTAAERGEAQELAALLAGAAFSGWDRAHIEGGLLGLCSDHFLDLGQGLVQVSRVFDLLEGSRATPSQAAQVLAGLGLQLAQAERWDGQQAWTPLRRCLDSLDLAALHRTSVTGAPAWFDRGGLLRALLELEPEPCAKEWIKAIQGGVPLPDLVEVLAVGAAERLLRADLRHDFDPRVPQGWMELAQALTHAQALQEVVSRWHDARVIRLLLFGVWRVAELGVLDGEPTGLQEARAGDVPALLQAAALRDPDQAVAMGKRVTMPALRNAVMRLGLDGQTALPVQSAHRSHAALAALRLSEELPDEQARLPLLGVLRYLSAPRQERRLRKNLAEAWAWGREEQP
ncbi:MAG: hypothetical protein ACI9VR_002168 [Cognaticolwellia sp.]|jgi:hypothetical protein